MANRPYFKVNPNYPYYTEESAEFTYNSGFSVVQKQKNIRAIHAEYHIRYPKGRILEISSKSTVEEGTQLSAFSLLMHVPGQEGCFPVENVYQSAKVFVNGGPYAQLLTVSPKEAKRSSLLLDSGAFRGYRFDGKEIPTEPSWLFYNWLYIRALREPENAQLAAYLEEYDAFTDIEFNPGKSLNCQARAAAMYVSLKKAGKLECADTIESFCAAVCAAPKTSAALKKKAACKISVLVKGDRIVHAKFGEGTVLEVNGSRVKIRFREGDKTLSLAFVKENCKKKGAA